MLRVRLQRVGRKNDPSFRVVVTDSKNATKSGSFIEVLGSYNARFGKPQLNGDRIKYWISQGAQPSETVHNMLVHYKIVEGKKVNNLPKKKEVEKPKEEPVVKEEVKEVVEEVVAEETEQAEEVQS